MKRVAIIQPGYLPWLGFFELMASSDAFVIYDDVQFDKNGWRNRNRIKTPHGIQWLSVPVLTRGRNKPRNNEITIKDLNWRKKHLKAIFQNYRKARYFDEVYPMIEKSLQVDSDRLIDFDMSLVQGIADYMKIRTRIMLSSDLGIEGEDRAMRLINVCKHLGATHYYNGAAGKELYRKEDFKEYGITLEFQEYKHPAYSQLYGDFVPYLSVVDLIFNEGGGSLDIILSGRNVI